MTPGRVLFFSLRQKQKHIKVKMKALATPTATQANVMFDSVRQSSWSSFTENLHHSSTVMSTWHERHFAEFGSSQCATQESVAAGVGPTDGAGMSVGAAVGELNGLGVGIGEG